MFQKFKELYEYFYYYKLNKFLDTWYDFRIRFIRKYSLIDTKLDKWRYYDKDDLMFHGMFSLLVDYVEIELASMYENSYIVDETFKKKWQNFIEFFGKEQPNPEYGKKYLEKALDKDYFNEDGYEDCGEKYIEHHYHKYSEIKDLYYWYKEEYLNRKDHWDDKISIQEKIAIDEEHRKEEEENLIRLIKIRRYLWT